MHKVWPVLLWAVNVTIIGLLIGRVKEIDNDKAPLVFLFGYPVLIVMNLVVWGLLALFKSRFAGPVGNCVLFLALLFLPLLLYAFLM
jgi:hypothetical protein